MPHLRRQPNPRDIIPNQDSNAPGNLRAQFQTPPTRHTPTNPTHRQQPPSTGPNALTPDPVAVAGHPAAPINPFTIFGRPRVEQLPPQMMDHDDFDDDFDPRGHSMQELSNDGPLDFDDSFDNGQAIEGQFDDSDIDGEELEEEVEDQFGDEEDPDQEMHDRGTDSSSHTLLVATIPDFELMSLCYRKITLPLTTQLTRDLIARFLDRFHLQAGMRRRGPPQPFPSTILAIRRTTTAHLNPPLLQTGSCRAYPRIS